MKIQKLSVENRPKAYALLNRTFSSSGYEARLIQMLHENDKPLQEWVCIHVGKVIAYIAFSNAYCGDEVCGLHLAPMAVSPEFQREGVGTELLNFSLRQTDIKSQTLFVLGEPSYYQMFGFELCESPICPFDRNNAHFLSLRNTVSGNFEIGYEMEFKAAQKPGKASKQTISSKNKSEKSARSKFRGRR